MGEGGHGQTHPRITFHDAAHCCRRVLQSASAKLDDELNESRSHHDEDPLKSPDENLVAYSTV